MDAFSPTTQVQHQRIQVNGLSLGVTQYRPVAGGRRTLVLLHGFTGSADDWAPLAHALSASATRIIALDLIGHGDSDAPLDAQRYTLEYCQADILAVLRVLGVVPGEAILLGYSMGGRVALYTAFSNYFRALVLESASPGLETELEREQRRRSDEALATRIEHDGVEAFVDYWERLPLFATQEHLPEEQRASQRRQRLHNNATGLANSLRGMGTGVQPPLHGRLAELTIPVLLIAGELDSKFRAINQQMAESLPRARLQIVAVAGHNVHLEQPEVFAQLVRDFCESPVQ